MLEWLQQVPPESRLRESGIGSQPRSRRPASLPAIPALEIELTIEVAR